MRKTWPRAYLLYPAACKHADSNELKQWKILRKGNFRSLNGHLLGPHGGLARWQEIASKGECHLHVSLSAVACMDTELDLNNLHSKEIIHAEQPDC